MIITAVLVYAITTGSVKFGFGVFLWAIVAFVADCLIASATSNGG